eukprot:TRINITY_DN5968_c0_g1_i2.p1 TRINITY_DN5968_c0_g1~~TRINITY_DN5968_c0_g1_i2.p1  ORF type:complete len:731 (+),score=184.76 TRINITY_DN5968_c0_g1_i2:304-2496(+)
MEGFCKIYEQKCIQLQTQPLKSLLGLFEKAAKRGAKVTNLDLSHKSLDSKAVIPIAAALGHNITITHINLSYNLIDKHGARALSTALCENKHLVEIDLAGNRIGDHGAKLIADALNANRTLKTLNLKNNGIGDEGICDIASSLTVNQTLVSLDLGQNTLNPTGSEALVTAMQYNAGITKLGLSNTNIPPIYVSQLTNLVGQNGLVYIDIRGTPLPDNVLHNLQRAQKKAERASSIDTILAEPKSEPLQSSTDSFVQQHYQTLENSFKREMSLLSTVRDSSDVAEKLSKRFQDVASNLKTQLSQLNEEKSVLNSVSRLSMNDDNDFVSLVPTTPRTPRDRTSTTVVPNGTELDQYRKISQLEGQIAVLRELNHKYSNQISDLQSKLKGQAHKHKRQIETSNASAVGTEERLKHDILTLRDQVQQLERDLIDRSKKMLGMQHEMEHLKYIHNQDAKLLKKRYSEKQSETRSYAHEQVEEVSIEFAEFKQKSKEEFFTLYADYEAVKKQLVGFQAELNFLNEKIKTHNDEIEHERSLRWAAEEKAEQGNRIVNGIEQERREYQRRIQELQDLLSQKDVLLSQYKDDLVLKETENERLNSWIQGLQKTLSSKGPSPVVTNTPSPRASAPSPRTQVPQPTPQKPALPKSTSKTNFKTPPPLPSLPSTESLQSQPSRQSLRESSNSNKSQTMSPVSITLNGSPLSSKFSSTPTSSASDLLDAQLERLLAMQQKSKK